MERREDMRRAYLRTFGNVEISNPPPHRRFDMAEPSHHRFMIPSLSALVPPTSGHVPIFPSPTRMPFPVGLAFPPHMKNNNVSSQ